MPGDPGECREHAKTCLRMAAQATRPYDQEVFEDLARTWMRLARDLESSAALLKDWGNDTVARKGPKRPEPGRR
jgi:hypothetical protein